MLLVALAALSAVMGVGYAASGSEAEPTQTAPDPNADEFYVAGPDGGALKCNGKLVKVKRSEIGGKLPDLTPAQALRLSKVRDTNVKVARCGQNGRVKWVNADDAG